MTVTKNTYFKLILGSFFLGLALPAQGMDLFNDVKEIVTRENMQTVTFLAASSFYGSEVAALVPVAFGAYNLADQDHEQLRFGGENKVDESIVTLITEVAQELGMKGNLNLLKMNPSAVCIIAQEYQFLGIHPANGILYVDETYLKSRSQDDQKILIKSALKHYMNYSYAKMEASNILASALCGYLSVKGFQGCSGFITETLKNAFSIDMNDPSDSFFTPIGFLKKSSSFIFPLVASGLINKFLQKKAKEPVTKYITKNCHRNVQNEFDNEDDKKILEETRKICDKDEVARFIEKFQKEAETVKSADAFQLAFNYGRAVAKYEKTFPELTGLMQNLIQETLNKHNNNIRQ